MDLTLDETQQMLKNTAKDFFATECTETHVREMENENDGYSNNYGKKLLTKDGLEFLSQKNTEGLAFLFLSFVFC